MKDDAFRLSTSRRKLELLVASFLMFIATDVFQYSYIFCTEIVSIA